MRLPECFDPQCDGNHSTEDDPGYDEGFHPPLPADCSVARLSDVDARSREK